MQVLQGQEERAHGRPSPLLGAGVRSSPLFRCWAALRAGIRLHQNFRKGKLNSNSLHQDTRGGEILTIIVPRSANYAVVDKSHLWLGSSRPSKRGQPPRVLGGCGIHRITGLCAVPSLNWHSGSLVGRQSSGFLQSYFPFLVFTPSPTRLPLPPAAGPTSSLLVALSRNSFLVLPPNSREAAFPLLFPPTTSSQWSLLGFPHP